MPVVAYDVSDRARSSRDRGWWYEFCAWFIAIMIVALAYRARLAWLLFGPSDDVGRPVAFIPEWRALPQLGVGLGWDLLLAASAAALAAAWLYVLLPRGDAPGRHIFRRAIAWGVVCIGLAVLVVIHAIHLGVLRDFRAPPTGLMLSYALSASRATDYLVFATYGDLLYLAIAPLALFAGYACARVHFVPVVSLAALTGVASLLALVLSRADARELRDAPRSLEQGRAVVTALHVDWALVESPVKWLFDELVRRGGQGQRFAAMVPRNPLATRAFVSPKAWGNCELNPGTPAGRPNVVIVQLESVRATHFFGDSGDQTAFPRLRALSSRGWAFVNHFATGVDTDVASFSLFTGLYPPARPIPLIGSQVLSVPTLFTHLEGYQSLLVTSSDTRFWFPIDLLRNSGLQEIYDDTNLTVKRYMIVHTRFRDERETAAFFADRVIGLREPFIAVYLPYATHAPYFRQRSRANESAVSGSKLERFLESAALVDEVVANAIERIAASPAGRNTLFVITSDHGESFGERPGAGGHGLELYNEATRVPFVLYWPERLAPRAVTDVSSHVDVVPTVLHLLLGDEVKNSDLAMQGRSWCSKQPRRESVFMYSPKSDRLAAVDPNGEKLILDWQSDRCERYAALNDPWEKRDLGCEDPSVAPKVDELVSLRAAQLNTLLRLANDRRSAPAERTGK